MDLSRFEGKPVRVTDKFGTVYEGICSHNSIDYDEHEFGVSEEALQFPAVLVWKSIIVSVESLEDVDGPYGHFSAPFGEIEEIAFQEGPSLIDEILFCEEDQMVIRILNCIEHHFCTLGEPLPEWKDELTDLLKQLPWFTEDLTILEKSDKLIALLTGRETTESKF